MRFSSDPSCTYGLSFKTCYCDTFIQHDLLKRRQKAILKDRSYKADINNKKKTVFFITFPIAEVATAEQAELTSVFIWYKQTCQVYLVLHVVGGKVD